MTHENITIDASAGSAEAFLAHPDSGNGPWPGVLFLIDAIGLRPRIEEMADRIASWGYVVLAPNLFYRDGTAADLAPSEPLTTPEAREAFFADVMPRVRALTDDLVTPDLSAYLDALRGLPDVAPGDLGATGYCMGGRLALLAAATRPDDVGAIGLFHTGGLVTEEPTSPHRRLSEVRAELLAQHADNDHSLPPAAVAEFEHALTSAGVVHHASVYPDAAHGYTMSDTAAFHPEATEQHFTDLRALFARTLSRG
ncbi:dienelactone hydrolase family protein [Gordonia soli]|uniref:Putative hydrolase n=1 Tax=Gordonia soli NBRC 108243 TaxID=1223545 RepID=M0QEN6_9ACTN|nr:dienelactone hydrolase family protein [Gordonia soli]GAC67060.1 putative hydrolase [Gordonia soli NBRC 108243]